MINSSGKISSFEIKLIENPPAIQWRLRDDYKGAWQELPLPQPLFNKLAGRCPQYLHEEEKRS